jgi:hypothetical protein
VARASVVLGEHQFLPGEGRDRGSSPSCFFDAPVSPPAEQRHSWTRRTPSRAAVRNGQKRRRDSPRPVAFSRPGLKTGALYMFALWRQSLLTLLWALAHRVSKGRGTGCCALRTRRFYQWESRYC